MAEEFKEEEVLDYESARGGSIDPPLLDDNSRSNQSTHQKQPNRQNDLVAPPTNSQRRPPPRVKNERFQDVEKTGRWGSISRIDKIIIGCVFLVVIGAAIAGIVIGVQSGNSPSSTPAPRTPSPTPAPTIPPDIAAEVQFPIILEAIVNNQFFNGSEISNDASYYQNYANRALAKNALEKAMFWSIMDDPAQPKPDDPWLIPRFALAALYFATGGEQWTVQDNWLTIASACNWHGVYCDRFNNYIREIDLTNNNLVGSIPVAINMLSEIIGVTLTSNELSGTVPWLALGSLPSLSFLALNNNQLEGNVSADVRSNQVLSKFDACSQLLYSRNKTQNSNLVNCAPFHRFIMLVYFILTSC